MAVPTPDGSCALKCEAPRMIPRPPDEPDYTAHEIENANLVLSAMHDDLLACYRRRVAQTPGAHGFITADIVIGPEGHVQIVETTGGAILGDATMKCIVTRIERGIFDPPHGGGTIHVIVPFSLLRVTKAEDDAN